VSSNLLKFLEEKFKNFQREIEGIQYVAITKSFMYVMLDIWGDVAFAVN